MAFVPSTIKPSNATTFADLKAGGLRGQVEAVIAANDLKGPEAEVIRQSMGAAVLRGLSVAVDQWLGGLHGAAPVPREDIEAQVASYARQAAVISQAVAEVAAIVHAHPGQLGHKIDRTAQGQTFVRTH